MRYDNPLRRILEYNITLRFDFLQLLWISHKQRIFLLLFQFRQFDFRIDTLDSDSSVLLFAEILVDSVFGLDLALVAGDHSPFAIGHHGGS